ncbi:MAG: response regulator [Burkholderiales bacterium]|nr:response regulator [Burkholderiales bacterium]
MSRGRLLVVDDDRLVLATLVQGLEDAGYEVIDADNGDDAILLARQHRPDLALLDIRMDGLSGFDVAAYLRDHLHIPFIFLSAFSDAATLAKIHALGALASLVKPLDLEQIVPAVATAHAQALSLRASAGTPAEANSADAAAAATAGAGIDAVEAAGAAPMVLGLSAAPARGVGSAAGVRPGQAVGAGAGVSAAPLDPGRAALQQPVAIALGIVMHRYSLKRGAALARLEQRARQEGRGLVESCAAFVAALEQLSLPD